MPKLLVEEGPEQNKSFTFVNEAVLGRRSANTVALKDPNISRKHSKVFRDGGRYRIRDLGSRNGTFKNGAKIVEEPLNFGDRIKIGSTVLRFIGDESGIQVGDEIAGYTILEKIGEGGMGAVFQARQNSMDRIVALKVLHKTMVSDESFVERFINEARAAGRLNHPNVIQVHDVGNEGDVHYFSMEHVDGKTLREMLKEQSSIPLTRLLHYINQTALALDYAHQNGIVHRDIKPDNIMITHEDEIKVADLGIAKSMQEATSSTHIEGRVVFGTPHYMAPEQAMGHEVDGRADIYSLGATFYHALTGQMPFTGQTITEVIRKHVTEQLPAIQIVNPDVPDPVCVMIEKMMAKEPTRRYQTPAEIIKEIERLESGKDLLAKPLSADESTILKGLSAAEKRILREGGVRAKLLIYRKQMKQGILVGLAAASFIAVILGAKWFTEQIDKPLQPSSGGNATRSIPTQPGSGVASNDIQARWEAALALEQSGELTRAQEAYQNFITSFPGQENYIHQARIQLEGIAQKQQLARGSEAENKLQTIKKNLDAKLVERETSKVHLQALIDAYPETDIVMQAQALINQINKEQQKRQSLQQKREIDAIINEAKQISRKGKIDQAVSLLKTKVIASYPETLHGPALQYIEDLNARGKSMVEKAENIAQRKMKVFEFDSAISEFERLQKRLGKGAWCDYAEEFKQGVIQHAHGLFEPIRAAAREEMKKYDFAGARQKMQKMDNWQYETLSFKREVRDFFDTLIVIEGLHQKVVSKIEQIDKEDPNLPPFEIENLGKVLIRGANTEIIEFAFKGVSAGTGKRWKDLSFDEVKGIYELFLNMNTLENRQFMRQFETHMKK